MHFEWKLRVSLTIVLFTSLLTVQMRAQPCLTDRCYTRFDTLVRELGMQVIPEIVFDSSDIQLDEHWFLDLKIKHLYTNVSQWANHHGKSGPDVKIYAAFELVASKVEWKMRKEHPQSGIWAGVLKHYRKEKGDIIDFKHHEDLKAFFTVYLDMTLNLLDEEFEHTRTTFEETWNGQTKPRANFWEIDLQAVAGKKLQQHFRNFAQALTDTVRKDISLINRRTRPYLVKTGRELDYNPVKRPDFPFRFVSFDRLKRIYSRGKGAGFKIEGCWKAKVACNPYHGTFGKYYADFYISFIPGGILGFSDPKFRKSILVPKSMKEDPEEVFEERLDIWRKYHNMENVFWHLNPSRFPRYDYYMTLSNDDASMGSAVPLIVLNRNRIVLFGFTPMGDLIAFPLVRVQVGNCN